MSVDLVIRLCDGSSITTYDSEMETPEAVRSYLREYAARPSWVQLGSVVCFSQNIVSVEAVDPDDGEE